MGRGPTSIRVMWRRTVIACVLVFACASSAEAQQSPGSVETRTAALSRILSDYHDEQLKHEPELATPAGDTRYNDQLSNLSASAENAWLSRGQEYILRLSAIDMTGVPDKVRLPAERLLNSLIEEQDPSHIRRWQMPVEQFSMLNDRLLAIAAHLPFTTIKDYDDYIARLRKLPAAMSQVMTNLQLGADDGRLPTKSDVDKVQTQVQAVAGKVAEDNPYAAPLRRFPTSIQAPDRKRIQDDLLDAIATAVIPVYQRLGRFIAAMPVPAAHVGRNGEANAMLAREATR